MTADPVEFYEFCEDENKDEDTLLDAEMLCGELAEGGCMALGTEYCDFSCPFSNAMRRRVKRLDEAQP
jgi:hypothetical protein